MIIGDVWSWFTTGDNWRGTDGVPHRLLEHITISAESMAIAVAVALPIALVLGHVGRGGFLAVNMANVGRAIPSLALLTFVAIVFQKIGTTPAIVALVALAIPPMITNTYVGIREVDPDVVEAARGMGLSGRQLLLRVEVPLAVPLILAGVRTAAVQVVATATLAALVAAGGLGRYIVDGFGTQHYDTVYAGAILVALLALVTELSLGLLQRALTPGARRHRVRLAPGGAAATPGGGAGGLGSVAVEQPDQDMARDIGRSVTSS
jgi:osmoprotectant transport system permease protein